MKRIIIKSLAFISGPALGHVGRLYQIAKRLTRQEKVKVTFFIPHFSNAVDVVIGDQFEVVKIHIPDGLRATPFAEFGDQLEGVLAVRKFDLIICDGCPVRWFSAVRFPDCPRIYMTNIFLTGHYTQATFQNKWFQDIAQTINDLRERKGLKKLKSVFELYNADKVLLSDPPELFRREMKSLPDHFVWCGPIVWSSKETIPDPIRKLESFTLISMGSTGKRSINDHLVRAVRELTKSSNMIYAGHQADHVRSISEIDHAYKFLPLNRMLASADAVVTQGGSGSSYQALSKGVPVIAFPTHINQQILGEILELNGLGVCINRKDSISKIATVDFEEIKANAQKFSESYRAGGARAMKTIQSYL